MPRSIAEEFVEAPLPGHRIHTISLGVNSQDTRFTRSLHLFGAPPRRLGEGAPRRGGSDGGTFAVPGGGTGLPNAEPEELSVVEPAGKEVSRIEKKRDVGLV